MSPWKRDFLAADRVIRNGDPAYTYKNLIASTYRKTWTDRRIDRLKYSMGLYVLYFGTDRTYDDVEHHDHIWRHVSGVAAADLRRRRGQQRSEPVFASTHRYGSCASSYGKDAFYVLAPVNLQRGDLDVKHQVKERVLDILERSFTRRRNHLEVCFDFDPTDFAQ